MLILAVSGSLLAACALTLVLGLPYGRQYRAWRRQGQTRGTALVQAGLDVFRPVAEQLRRVPALRELSDGDAAGNMVAAGPEAVLHALALATLILVFTAGAAFFGALPPGAAAWSGAAAYPLVLAGMVLRRRREQAQWRDAMRRQLPFFLDMLTLCVQAGLGVQAALQQAVQVLPEGPLKLQLGRTMSELRAGLRASSALQGMARRTQLDELQSLALALGQAEQFGLSLSQILKAQAQHQRHRRAQEAEKRALQAPVHLLAPLVICIFPCTFLVLAMTLFGSWLQGGG